LKFHEKGKLFEKLINNPEFGTSVEEKDILEAAAICKEICGGTDFNYNQEEVQKELEFIIQVRGDD
jgi:hypothetical protein